MDPNAFDAVYWQRVWDVMSAPFPIEAIRCFRGKGGASLAYADERHFIARLNDAAGAGNWSRQYSILASEIVTTQESVTNRIITTVTSSPTMMNCTITIASVSRDGIGTESNIEEEKGAASNAFKRACVPFGALYFYLMGPILLTILDRTHFTIDDIKKNKDDIDTEYARYLTSITHALEVTPHIVPLFADAQGAVTEYTLAL